MHSQNLLAVAVHVIGVAVGLRAGGGGAYLGEVGAVDDLGLGWCWWMGYWRGGGRWGEGKESTYASVRALADAVGLAGDR